MRRRTRPEKSADSKILAVIDFFNDNLNARVMISKHPRIYPLRPCRFKIFNLRVVVAIGLEFRHAEGDDFLVALDGPEMVDAVRDDRLRRRPVAEDGIEVVRRVFRHLHREGAVCDRAAPDFRERGDVVESVRGVEYRIRRAGKKIAEELAAKNAEIAKKNEQGELGLENPDNPVNPVEKEIPDIGFRVLKLDSSSLEDTAQTVSEINQLALKYSRLKTDRSADDLLFQVLLETRLPLSDSISKSEVAGNEVIFVGGTGAGAPLVACLDAKAKMTTEFFLEIAKLKPGLAFFRDDALADDSARTNLQQAFDQFSPTTSIKVI